MGKGAFEHSMYTLECQSVCFDNHDDDSFCNTLLLVAGISNFCLPVRTFDIKFTRQGFEST